MEKYVASLALDVVMGAALGYIFVLRMLYDKKLARFPYAKFAIAFGIILVAGHFLLTNPDPYGDALLANVGNFAVSIGAIFLSYRFFRKRAGIHRSTLDYWWGRESPVERSDDEADERRDA